MQLPSIFILFILGLKSASSQPHRHIHQKRVDYSQLSLHNDIDWSKVNYEQGAPAHPSPQENQQEAQPQESSTPAGQAASDKERRTPSSTSDAQASSGSSNKRGLVYNWESPSLSIFSPYIGKSLCWAWNWDSTPFNLPQGIDFAPTLHSLKSEATGPWAENAKKAIASANGGLVHLIGFNEPDIADQANLSPGAAAAAWRQYIQPFAGKNNVQLGSPQVSNGVGTNPATGQPYGLDWLTSFLSSCAECQVDFLVVHWYGCTDGCSVDTDVVAFKDFVTKAEGVAAAKERKIWITEFATHNSDQAGFIGKVLPWLDAEGGVERYAYFMVKEGSLTQGNGLSAAGDRYVGA